MRMHFPTGNFQYLSLAGLKELFDYFTNTKGLDFKQNSKHGVLICCDISIPDESVARLLEILPPCLESKDIKEEDISPHMKTLKDKLRFCLGSFKGRTSLPSKEKHLCLLTTLSILLADC